MEKLELENLPGDNVHQQSLSPETFPTALTFCVTFSSRLLTQRRYSLPVKHFTWKVLSIPN